MKELFSRLTWADYIALMALLRGLYVGYKSGVFQELLRVAGYVLTLVLALLFYEFLAAYLTLHTFLNEPSAKNVSLGILIVGIYIGIKLLRTLLLKILKVGEGGVAQRMIGAAIGGTRLLVLLSFFFLLVEMAPFKELKNDVHQRSLTGPYISQVAPAITEFISGFSGSLRAQVSNKG